VAVAVEPLVRTVPLVSPLRGGGVTGSIDVLVRAGSAPVARPAPRPPEPPIAAVPVQRPTASGTDLDTERATDDEPPWPEEAQRQEAVAAERPTVPLEAGAGHTLHVRFGSAPLERVVEAFGVLRELFAGRPGETPVVLHVPAGAGREQPMQLRAGVAYDAELLGDVQRRVGGLVLLQLS
jgi:hypothetical protein